MSKKKFKNIENFAELTYLNGRLTLQLRGSVVLSNAGNYNKILNSIDWKGLNEVFIDSSQITDYDSYAVTLIQTIKKEAESRNITLDLSGLNPELLSFYNYFNLFISKNLEVRSVKRNTFLGYVEKIGIKAKSAIREGIEFLSFLGEVTRSMLIIPFSPKRVRWADFPLHLLHIGINALPIALLIVFLLGLVTGYQGALQLKMFGGDIYIADLISVSLTRELSPLMVAIIVAGRSGSAFTAEIGTMKIGEEIDALKMMGFNTINFIVMPRILAAFIAVPIIVMFANLAGILGGLLASFTTLDITSSAFFNRMQEVLYTRDILSGLIKSVFFAFFITLIGCYKGFQVTGGAEGVGRYTTSSVVTSIFHIILIDSVCTIIFPIIGL